MYLNFVAVAAQETTERSYDIARADPQRFVRNLWKEPLGEAQAH